MANFTRKQRLEILARDNYKCVLCGNGGQERFDLYVEPLLPTLEPPFSIDDGCTICSRHHFRAMGKSLLNVWAEEMEHLTYTIDKSHDSQKRDFAIEMVKKLQELGLPTNL